MVNFEPESLIRQPSACIDPIRDLLTLRGRKEAGRRHGCWIPEYGAGIYPILGGYYCTIVTEVDAAISRCRIVTADTVGLHKRSNSREEGAWCAGTSIYIRERKTGGTGAAGRCFSGNSIGASGEVIEYSAGLERSIVQTIGVPIGAGGHCIDASVGGTRGRISGVARHCNGNPCTWIRGRIILAAAKAEKERYQKSQNIVPHAVVLGAIIIVASGQAAD